MALTLQSNAFTQGGDIPVKYTCQGENTSPPLSWFGLPIQAKSLALIVDDPDAPDPQAPTRTWVHWVVYNIPTSIEELPEGAGQSAYPGILQGVNDWNNIGYGGPCPPVGRHRYFHKLYTLDIVLPELDTPTKANLEIAMQGHIIESTELVGMFAKHVLAEPSA